MRVEYRRCNHCNVKYMYTSSGHCKTKYNDSEYCPDCKKVVLDALQDVPIRVKEVFVTTDEITYDELVRKHEEELERQKKQDEIFGRYTIPLYPLTWTGDSNDDIKYYYANGRTYRVYSNKEKNIINRIEVKKEMDLLTGKLTNYWW